MSIYVESKIERRNIRTIKITNKTWKKQEGRFRTSKEIEVKRLNFRSSVKNKEINLQFSNFEKISIYHMIFGSKIILYNGLRMLFDEITLTWDGITIPIKWEGNKDNKGSQEMNQMKTKAPTNLEEFKEELKGQKNLNKRKENELSQVLNSHWKLFLEPVTKSYWGSPCFIIQNHGGEGVRFLTDFR